MQYKTKIQYFRFRSDIFSLPLVLMTKTKMFVRQGRNTSRPYYWNSLLFLSSLQPPLPSHWGLAWMTERPDEKSFSRWCPLIELQSTYDTVLRAVCTKKPGERLGEHWTICLPHPLKSFFVQRRSMKSPQEMRGLETEYELPVSTRLWVEF
jgi:hypothetical protein